jgi:predicted DNA-binding transcriptional regulator AlpA
MQKRIYRYRDIRDRGINYTPKHIRTLEEQGKFPRRFALGEHSVAYVAEEVEDWISQKIRTGRVTA